MKQSVKQQNRQIEHQTIKQANNQSINQRNNQANNQSNNKSTLYTSLHTSIYNESCPRVAAPLPGGGPPSAGGPGAPDRLASPCRCRLLPGASPVAPPPSPGHKGRTLVGPCGWASVVGRYCAEKSLHIGKAGALLEPGNKLELG